MKRFYLFLSILFLTIFMSSCSNDPSNPSPEEGYSKLIIKAEITINKTPFHFMPILNFIWMTSICFLP